MSDRDDILVGDVGGTNARLARARFLADGGVELSAIARKPVASATQKGFASLEAALADWVTSAEAPIPRHAVFALAGITGADEVRFTNSDWVVSASGLKARFGFDSVLLVNDFAAQARAVPALGPDDVEVLHPGVSVAGAPVVVLGPGTGLGQSILVPDGHGGWIVLPTEAGHQAFAPLDARERAILEAVAADHRAGYVSFENLVSGAGLATLYATLCTLNNRPARLVDAREIGPAAVSGDDPMAVEAAEVLALALATFAGDAVLACLARGGCVIAGGVAEALAPFLRTPAFLARFKEHGPISHQFETLPLSRVRDPFAALKGAAFFAPRPST
jgi:glucokinase